MPRRKSTATAGRIYPNLVAFFEDSANPSQMELAEELGISNALMSMIKCRQREPDITLAIKIMGRCRVPLESLIRIKTGN